MKALDYYWQRKDELNKKYIVAAPVPTQPAVSSSQPASNISSNIPSNNPYARGDSREFTSNQMIDLTAAVEEESSHESHHKVAKRSKIYAHHEPVSSLPVETTVSRRGGENDRGGEEFFYKAHKPVETPVLDDVQSSEYQNRMNRIKTYLNPNPPTISSSSSSSHPKVKAYASRAKIPRPANAPRPHKQSHNRAPKDHVLVTFDQANQKRSKSESQDDDSEAYNPSPHVAFRTEILPLRASRGRARSPVDLVSSSSSSASSPANAVSNVNITATAAETQNVTDSYLSSVPQPQPRRASREAMDRMRSADMLLDSALTLAEDPVPPEEPLFMWAEAAPSVSTKFKGYKEGRFIVYHNEEPFDSFASSSSSSSSTVHTTRALTANRACQYKLYLGRIGAKEDFMTVAFVKPFVVEPDRDNADLCSCRCVTCLLILTVFRIFFFIFINCCILFVSQMYFGRRHGDRQL